MQISETIPATLHHQHKKGSCVYESYWYRAPGGQSGAGGHPQGDPPHPAHPGGHRSGDLHRQGRRCDLPQILSLGDLQELAGQVCEAIHRNTGCIAAVCDTDAIVAVSGAPRRDLLDRSISARAGELLEQRRLLPPPAGGALTSPPPRTARSMWRCACPSCVRGI